MSILSLDEDRTKQNRRSIKIKSFALEVLEKLKKKENLEKSDKSILGENNFSSIK